MEHILAWEPLVAEIAPQYGLPVSLVLAIISVESNGNPAAFNKKSGATGLMQVIPSEYAPADWNRPTKEELLNPETNVAWGCKILSWFRKEESGDLTLALYRYSGGGVWLKHATAGELARYQGEPERVAFGRFGSGYLWKVLKAQIEIEAADAEVP